MNLVFKSTALYKHHIGYHTLFKRYALPNFKGGREACPDGPPPAAERCRQLEEEEGDEGRRTPGRQWTWDGRGTR